MTAPGARRLPHPPLLGYDTIRAAMQRWAPGDIRATPAQRTGFTAYTGAGDPAADALVALVARLPAAGQLVEAAITGGLRAAGDHPPAELAAFFGEAESVPYWADFDLLDRGAAVIGRTGLIGHVVLSMAALMGGYLAPRPIQPLLATGDLTRHARRRLADTLAWYTAVTTPAGLHPGAPGHQATIRVRLRHAQIRAAMNRRPGWDHDAWDHPLNQSQLSGTLMLFALVHQIGCRAAGLKFTTSEREAMLHLWRYTGHLLGIDPAILPATETDWWRLAWLQAGYEFGHRDPGSARLAHALLTALTPAARGPHPGRWQRANAAAATALLAAAARQLLGDTNADDLGLPDHRPARALLRAGARVVRAGETIRPLIPGATGYCERLGARAQQHRTARTAEHHPPAVPGGTRELTTRGEGWRRLAARAAAAPRSSRRS